ncbi:MAG TPA: hypothetical protein VH817_21955 [Thermoleophilaceae bacterium]
MEGRPEGPPVIREQRQHPDHHSTRERQCAGQARRAREGVEAERGAHERHRVLTGHGQPAQEAGAGHPRQVPFVAVALVPEQRERAEHQRRRQHVREVDGREREHERAEAQRHGGRRAEPRLEPFRHTAHEQQQHEQGKHARHEPERPDHSGELARGAEPRLAGRAANRAAGPERGDAEQVARELRLRERELHVPRRARGAHPAEQLVRGQRDERQAGRLV